MQRLLQTVVVILALAVPMQARAITPDVKRALLCIHRHEAAWTNPGLTWDGRRSKYYGGLQMDKEFQRRWGLVFYRRWGTANKWPVWAQLETGARAVRVISYSPWPQTRKPCHV